MSDAARDWDTAAQVMYATLDLDDPCDRSAPPRFTGPGPHVHLEPDERLVVVLPATDVRHRVQTSTDDVGWGPLNMRITVTSRRLVLSTVAVAAVAPDWSDVPCLAPVVLRIIEPPGDRRGLDPVRIAGQVQWDQIARVELEGSRVVAVMPLPSGVASLALRVPSRLGHRVLATGRAAFVDAGRALTANTPRQVGGRLAAS